MRRKPKPEKLYWFVKTTKSGVIAKVFMRDSDGGGLLYPDLYDVEYDGIWEELWDYLAQEGFVEERDAKRQGLIPPDWLPPELPWLPTS